MTGWDSTQMRGEESQRNGTSREGIKKSDDLRCGHGREWLLNVPRRVLCCILRRLEISNPCVSLERGYRRDFSSLGNAWAQPLVNEPRG